MEFLIASAPQGDLGFAKENERREQPSNPTPQQGKKHHKSPTGYPQISTVTIDCNKIKSSS